MSWLALCRGLHVAGLLSAFGSLLLPLAVAPAVQGYAAAPALQRRLRRLSTGSLLLALAAGVGWGLASVAAIADASGPGASLAAVPLVMTQTRFGRLLTLRLVLLAAAIALGGNARPSRLSRGLIVPAAILIQPLLGHAGAMGADRGAALSGIEMLHLLAAGAWLGGLLPLALCIAALPAERAALAAERFLPIGLASVLVLAGSGLLQGAALIGSRRALLGTAYGHLALLKLGLFIVLIGLACLNRLVLAPRLRRGGPARGPLLASVALETALGLGVVLTAAALGSTEPGIDFPRA